MTLQLDSLQIGMTRCKFRQQLRIQSAAQPNYKSVRTLLKGCGNACIIISTNACNPSDRSTNKSGRARSN